MPWISSCLITLARITDTMLNKSDKGRHLYLPPDLRGKTFSVSSLNMMLAIGFFVDTSYQFKEVLLYSLFAESLYHKYLLDIVQYFLCTN